MFIPPVFFRDDAAWMVGETGENRDIRSPLRPAFRRLGDTNRGCVDLGGEIVRYIENFQPFIQTGFPLDNDSSISNVVMDVSIRLSKGIGDPRSAAR